MKFRVVDFETTGFPSADGPPVGICEVGYTDLSIDHGLAVIHRPISFLVNPGLPIPSEARAVHHLSNDDVADAINPERALATLMIGMQPGDVFAAHNAGFERSLFTGGAFPWVCTMQCSKHLIDDAPNYQNQTLRYHLGLDADLEWPELAMPPHRAGPDSYITAHLLNYLTEGNSPAQLVQLTNTMVLQKKVGFGKHFGKLWSEMDIGFLEWVLERDFDAETKNTCRHWLQRKRNTNPFGV